MKIAAHRSLAVVGAVALALGVAGPAVAADPVPLDVQSATWDVWDVGGDYVTGGKNYSFDLQRDPTAFLGYGSPDYISLGIGNGVHNFGLQLWPVDGGSLAVGTYANALSVSDADHPGISFGGDGRGCSGYPRWFRILDIGYSAGSLTRIAVEFQSRCDDRLATARGLVTFNSDFPMPLRTSLDLTAQATATVREPVQVSGVLNSPNGPVPGATVTIERAGASSRRSVGTVVTDGQGRFTATDEFGSESATYAATYAGEGGLTGATGLRDVTFVRAIPTFTIKAPKTARRGESTQIKVSLAMLGEPVVDARVDLTVVTIDGHKQTRYLTDADGKVVVPYTFKVRGPTTFKALAPGSKTRERAHASVATEVERRPTTIKVRASSKLVNAGNSVRLSIELGPTGSNRDVIIWLRQPGREPFAKQKVRIPQGQPFTIVYKVSRPTRYDVTFAGDHRFDDATDRVTVDVRATVRMELANYKSYSGGYYRFRKDLYARVGTTPNRQGGCVAVVVEKWRKGDWRELSRNDCLVPQDQYLYVRYRGDRNSDARLRIRAEVKKTAHVRAGHSPWRYFTYA